MALKDAVGNKINALTRVLILSAGLQGTNISSSPSFAENVHSWKVKEILQGIEGLNKRSRTIGEVHCVPKLLLHNPYKNDPITINDYARIPMNSGLGYKNPFTHLLPRTV